MSVETSLIVIIGLLILILLFGAWQSVWTARWTKAITALTEQRNTSPNEDLQGMIVRRDYACVLDEVEKRMVNHPDDPELYWYKGLALFHREELEDALDALNRAVDMQPSFAERLKPYIDKIEAAQT